MIKNLKITILKNRKEIETIDQNQGFTRFLVAALRYNDTSLSHLHFQFHDSSPPQSKRTKFSG